MKKYSKQLKGVCPSTVEFSVAENGTVHNITFLGGCNGNLQALSRLCEGRKIDELDTMLSGITCGPRSTSCSNELVKFLKSTAS